MLKNVYSSEPSTAQVAITLTLPGGEEEGEEGTDQEEVDEEETQLRLECKELTTYFNHKLLEAILRATKLSLDLIRKRVFFQK